MEDKSTMYYPTQKRKIQPIILEYLNAIKNDEIISRFKLNAFDIQTIDPKRTLCDKISRLSRLSYENEYEMLIAKHIRDVYDIYCLLNMPEYVNFIKSSEFLDAMQQVTNEDGFYRKAQTRKSIAKARIFADTAYILKLPDVLRAYNYELKQLIFESKALPVPDAVIMAFSSLRQSLSQLDEKYR